MCVSLCVMEAEEGGHVISLSLVTCGLWEIEGAVGVQLGWAIQPARTKPDWAG